jgi:aryl-alcohol dehydrogenase-like predicted oxidoreductase
MTEYFDERRFAIGTVQFGLDYGISNISGKTEEKEVAEILETAWQNGIDTIDTANGYGDSENVLGKQLKHPFRIVTKFSASADSAAKIEESLLNSTKALQTKTVYGFLAHDADLLIKNPELWKSLYGLREKKLVEKIGYSLYTPEQLVQLIDLKIIPDIVQLPYNFLDQRFKPFFQELKSMGTEIHIRSVFLQGLFFMNPDKLSAHFEPAKPVLKNLQLALPDRNDLAAWLLQFVLKEKNIDKVVLGVNNSQQLNANLSGILNQYPVSIAAGHALPKEILMPYLWPKKIEK